MQPRQILTTCMLALYLMTLASRRAEAGNIGNPAKGKETYAQRCAACHSIDYNGAGPSHRALLGRKAGGVAYYAYSAALKASSVVWSAQSLDRWLADPEKLIPGQKMWVSVPDAVERQNIIAYLQSDIPR